METKKIYVNGDEAKRELAMIEAEQFADALSYDEREAMRLRLLTEELIGLLQGISGDEYDALFWIEGDRQACQLHLEGKTQMTALKREELLASATNRKNAAAVGIMGKIRDMVTAAVLNWNEAARIQAEYGAPVMDFYDAGVEMPMSSMAMSMARETTWSLSHYRETLESGLDVGAPESSSRREAWDELERSIIANLAQDVRVSIEKDTVGITVYYRHQPAA